MEQGRFYKVADALTICGIDKLFGAIRQNAIKYKLFFCCKNFRNLAQNVAWGEIGTCLIIE